MSRNPMDARQIALVRSSFIAAYPVSDTVAEKFYQRLFRARPGLRALFPSDMERQRRKLMDTLVAIVDDLDRPEAIRMAAMDLGRSHVGYRVADADYDLAGAALLDTLRDMLGPVFTGETEAAWRIAYTTIATLMIREAEKARAAVAAAGSV